MYLSALALAPGADTSSAAITAMIHKVQSAAARRTVIGDFNHFNFQKVLERYVIRPARHYGALLKSVMVPSGEVAESVSSGLSRV